MYLDDEGCPMQPDEVAAYQAGRIAYDDHTIHNPYDQNARMQG